MRKFILVTAILALLAGLAGWQLWERYQRFLETPLNLPAEGYVFQLDPGASGTEIIRRLSASGLTRQGWEWRLLMRLEPQIYLAGEYRLDAGMTPRGVLEHLASGQVVPYRITLVEGWTFLQFARAIAADPVLEHELDIQDRPQWPIVVAALGIEHPEGWFLPETYQFTRGDSDRDILLQAHNAMKSALEEAWASRSEDLPLDNSYQMLILASIIEKETSLDAERGQIAGVFTRRLQKGMRLQTDPTVIYGLGDAFDGDIRRRDLEADTPYNSYTRHGLPPTPIAMPGKASLMAAARPEPGDALFFVADGTGGHTFSATLEEHRKAVRKLMERG